MHHWTEHQPKSGDFPKNRGPERVAASGGSSTSIKKGNKASTYYFVLFIGKYLKIQI